MTAMTLGPDNPAMREATLPTVRMILAAAFGATVVGCAWAAITWFWQGSAIGMMGFAAAGLVTVGATIGLLLIQPWRPRPLANLPMIWILGGYLRMGATLGVTYLLYSAASSFHSRWLWLAVVASYMGAMYGEVMVYKASMKPLTPTPGVSAPVGDDSGSSSS